MRNKRSAYVTAIILFLVVPSLLLIAEAVSSIKDKRERASALAIEKIHSQESPIAIKEDTESIFSTENPKPTEYVIPYNKMYSTPKSTCFSEIGYDAENEILLVRFRDSGKAYMYLDFWYSNWNEFRSWPSLGEYYNHYIKGFYTSVKLDG